MKEPISELRSTIRRLRPFLLLSEESSSSLQPSTSTSSAAAVSNADGIVAAAAAAVAATSTTQSASSSTDIGTTKSKEAVDKNHVVQELQKESIVELVESLASFVYELDVFWSTTAAAGRESGAEEDTNGEEDDGKFNHNEDNDDGGGGGSRMSSTTNQGVRGQPQKPTKSIRRGHCEPQSEWNEESKLLVQEGYSMLLLATTTITNYSPRHRHRPPQQQRQNQPSTGGDVQQLDYDDDDSMTCLVRNSILDLLLSLNTSPCRHFLLSFLPQFMPSASVSSWTGSKNNDRHNIPSWLREDDNDINGIVVDSTLSTNYFNHLWEEEAQSKNGGVDKDNNALVSQSRQLPLVQKLLEVFQTLIQTDISTLAPLLANISPLFRQSTNLIMQHNDNVDAYSQQHHDSSQDDGTISAPPDEARSECFQLCLSSMSSVSEHDLPSLLTSLLALVRTVEEGRLVIDAVRREWVSIECTATTRNIFAGRMESNKVIVNGTAKRHPHDVDQGLVYIGEVILRFILSGPMPASNHVAKGFFQSLDNSLHSTHPTQITSGHDDIMEHAPQSSTPLTTLDVIVMIALYSHHEYQSLVESIIDSMTHHQTFAFFELMYSLIQSWMPSHVTRGSGGRRSVEREQTDSILYEPLASPLISILFYILMASSSSTSSSSSVASRGECVGWASLMGGLLPFCFPSSTPHFPNVTATTIDGGSCTASVTSTCCQVLSELYSSVDPNRQESIINSLLSMVSDSFVFSTSSDTSSKKHRRRNYQQGERLSSKATAGIAIQTQQCILLESARAACRTLLVISNHCGLNTSSMRGTILDRLLLLASKSVMKTSAPQAFNRDNDATVYYHLFDMNCALVISLLHANDEEGVPNLAHADGNEFSELFILCQKLLFSSNLVSTATSNSNNSYQHRAICGIILASRLLRCKLIPNAERGSIWDWVIIVISPTSSAATPLDALDPEVARWGLTLLQFASSVLPIDTPTFTSMDDIVIHGTIFPEMNRFVETQSVCGQGDVFNQVNKMLATAGIIQWENSLKVPLFLSDSRDTAPHTFLAFTDTSMYDQLSKQKSPTATSMVICGPHFLHGRLSRLECLHKSIADNTKHFLSSIDLVADYVYLLIDRYLELGTLKSAGWNPRGWLLAKSQLPCCLSESAMEILGMKRHNGLELNGQPEELSYDVECQWCARDDDFQKQWRLLFADESKVTVVQNLVEFVNSVIISISVSSAALKHAYQHFQRNEMCTSSQHTSDSNAHDNKSMQRRKRKQVEALRKLLQFQVSKILTMQKICMNIHLALSGLYSEVSKAPGMNLKNIPTSDNYNSPENTVVDTSRQSEEKATYQRKRIPLSDLKSIIIAIETFLSSKANHIDDPILWNCLDDDIDDDAIVEDMRHIDPSGIAQGGNSSHGSRTSMILKLREFILERLLHNILQMNSNISSASRMPHSEGPRRQQDSVSLRGISRLFRMTTSLLDVHFINNKGIHGKDMGALLLSHYKLLLAVFSSATKDTKPVLQYNIFRGDRSKYLSESACSSISSWFTDVIQSCAKMCGATFTSAKKDGTSSSTHSNSVAILREIFVTHLNGCNDASISCHIIDLVSILLINTEFEWSRGTLSTITERALCSVYTMSVGKTRNAPYALIKLNSILLEASTNEEKCLDSDRASFVIETFKNLIQSSKALLKAKDSLTSAFVHNILAHWSALILDGTSQIKFLTELVASLDLSFNRRSPQHRTNLSSSKRSSLAGLNEKSHASLFEQLLLMTTASLSLSKPRRMKKRCASADNIGETSPYGEIIGLMEVYGRLLLMFQANRINFPRRFIRTVVRSSSQMIRISDYQLRQCVQWRNSQPSQIGVGVDSAAAELLQPLVDSIASHCIGGITSFCNAIKVQQNGRKRSFDSSYEHTRAIAGLKYRCESIKETLHGICQSQNLVLPKDFTSTNDATTVNELSDDRNPAAKKKQRVQKQFSSQTATRLSGSINKDLKSPSILEFLPDSDVTMEMINDSIARQSVLQSDSDDSELNNSENENDQDSIKASDDDDDSFGVIGNWGATN